ncbi:SpoIIE family protein phosphatase, partial [Streptomyces sp. B1866]|uniref:SpoIIE family protein phosphatase n=1 Tax=Streptomyces sp. B1866 TaxID=3075431 RepID=UPI00289284FD
PPQRWRGSAALRHRDGRCLTARLLAHRQDRPDGRAAWLVVSARPGAQEPFDAGELTGRSFTHAPCAMAVYDMRLRLRLANDDMERVLGLTEADMRGLRIPEILPGAQAEETEAQMRATLRTGEPRHLEYAARPVGQDRESAWAVSLAPLRGRDGAARGVIVAAHDTTQQHGSRQRLLLLNEASVRIGSTLDIVRTAEELAEVAVPAFADFVTVDLLPDVVGGAEPPGEPLPSRAVLRRAAHRSSLDGTPEAVVRPGQLYAYPRGSATEECLATGRGVLLELSEAYLRRWDAQNPETAARLRRYGFHSTVCVPLRARGTTLGVATFSRHRRPEPFVRDDVLLAEEITARAAVCVDNARRYARERETALGLQRSLLPRGLPRNAAVEVASRYLPAGSRAGVGGDWFDVIPLSGARVALVVGDVVGHGVQASATMGRLRTAVRTLADVDLPPDELLTHLDDLVTRLSAEVEGQADDPGAGQAEVAGDIGTTCLYAVYDPVSRRCCAARAGHPGPAVVRPDGAVDFLDLPGGPPLGLGNLPFEAAEVELAEGSLLVLYTNGLLDSPGRDVDEALDALRAALSGPCASLEAFCETVLAALLPERPTDDVALLVARTRALDAGQVATWDLPHDPAVVAQARKDAAAQLTAWGLEEAGFTTELVVSELVTNAIRYAEPPIQLRLIHDRSLICEVSDASSTSPHLRRARMYDEGGRGLLLVAQLTQSWGTRHTTAGKTIWAEQDLADAR